MPKRCLYCSTYVSAIIKAMANETEFDLDSYRDELSEHLQTWAPELKIEILPLHMHWWRTNGAERVEGDTDYMEITVLKSDLGDKPVSIMLPVVEKWPEKSKHKSWRDAYEVQDKYFTELNIPKGSPTENGVYWKLWEHLEGC